MTGTMQGKRGLVVGVANNRSLAWGISRALAAHGAVSRETAVEMAAASGISLVTAGERDAIRATSIGTGDLIRAALNAGVSSIGWNVITSRGVSGP